MSRIPNIYRPPLGLPLNWRDETSGELPRAVFKYFAQESLTAKEIDLIAEYCQHYINAPCWVPGAYLASLRRAANLITSIADIDRWIDACLDHAIDPF